MSFQCYECGEIEGGRDRLLREHVSWKIAIMDAGRDIVELARELPPKQASRLLAIHAELIRLEAEDENHLQDILATIKRDSEAA